MLVKRILKGAPAMRRGRARKKELMPPPRSERKITKEDLQYLIEIQKSLSPFWAAREMARAA